MATIIGHMVASIPAVIYGALYYRNLHRDKTNALRVNKGILAKGVQEMQWCMTTLMIVLVT